jgi:hypothetical protein
MHSPEELMELIERLQVTMYGDPSRDKRGLVERMNTMEGYVSEIRDNLKKITWLLVAGVLGAGLNLVINTKNIAASHSQQPPPAAQQK